MKFHNTQKGGSHRPFLLAEQVARNKIIPISFCPAESARRRLVDELEPIYQAHTIEGLMMGEAWGQRITAARALVRA